MRVEKYDKQIVSFSDLEEWKDRHSTSNDDCDAFVLWFDSNPSEKTFTLVLTTRVLMQNLEIASIIQADGTYKLNYSGFPTIVVGTSDRARVLF